jgi:hypothetical protein
LLAVCNCLFNIFAATIHNWRPSPASAILKPVVGNLSSTKQIGKTSNPLRAISQMLTIKSTFTINKNYFY